MTTAARARGPYRKGVEHRRQLVQAASVVFARRGYVAASLREVAEEVGLSLTGLLRLFGTKEKLLAAVLERWGEEGDTLRELLAMGDGLSYFAAFPDLIRHHERHPGFMDLFLTLCAESSDPEHPARPWVSARYREIVERGVRALEIAESAGQVLPMSPAVREAEVRGLFAAMDGLQLQRIVDPEVGLVALFDGLFTATMQRWTNAAFTIEPRPDPVMESWPLTQRSRPAERPVPARTSASPNGTPGSYRTGIERREQIVDVATRVFAVRGYLNASLREIAAEVGVTAAALVRYFGTKEELLLAVLERWDLDSEASRVLHAHGAGLGYFEALVVIMGRHREHPGLIELLLTLDTEATDPEHPARGWLIERYRRIVRNADQAFVSAQARREIRSLSAAQREAEARWYFAVMDGLELQWMSDPDLDLEAIFEVLHGNAVQRWKDGATGAA